MDEGLLGEVAYLPCPDAPGPVDAAALYALKPQQRFDKGALARAVLAQYAEVIPLLDGEVQSADHDSVLVSQHRVGADYHLIALAHIIS